MREAVINSNTCGGRLDKFASVYLGRAPLSFVYRMLRKKNIVLNDKKAHGNELLKAGDSIKFYISEETICSFKNQMGENKKTDILPSGFRSWIVYEDENILAVNKPAGILSQKAKASDISLNEMINAYLGDKDFISGVANRLDRNTSGIILAAKTPAAARQLSAAIKEHRLSKIYLCVVKGKVSNTETLQGYLAKDEKTNKVFVQLDKPCAVYAIPENSDNKDKKQRENMLLDTFCIKTGIPENSDNKDDKGRIITKYAPVACNGDMTLLQVKLITGKTHQIRAHLASAGHPVAGDYKYGDKAFNEYFKNKYGLKSQLLHAWKIDFTDMKDTLEYLNGQTIKAEAPGFFVNIAKNEGIWKFKQ